MWSVHEWMKNDLQQKENRNFWTFVEIMPLLFCIKSHTDFKSEDSQ